MTLRKHIDFEVPGWGELAHGPVNWSPPASYLDAFDRADEPLEASSHWRQLAGQAAVVSGQCVAQVGALYARAGQWPADQFAQVTFRSQPSATTRGLGAVRLPTTGTGGYAALREGISAAVARARLVRLNADGSTTTLATSPAQGGFMPAGSVVRVEARGTQLRLLVNGAAVLAADDDAWPAGSPGLANLGASAAVTLDDAQGGEL